MGLNSLMTGCLLGCWQQSLRGFEEWSEHLGDFTCSLEKWCVKSLSTCCHFHPFAPLSSASISSLKKCDLEILSSERLYWSPGGLGVFHCGRSDGFFTVPDRHVHLINGCCYSYRQSLSSLCSIGAGNHWFQGHLLLGCWQNQLLDFFNCASVYIFHFYTLIEKIGYLLMSILTLSD